MQYKNIEALSMIDPTPRLPAIDAEMAAIINLIQNLAAAVDLKLLPLLLLIMMRLMISTAQCIVHLLQ